MSASRLSRFGTRGEAFSIRTEDSDPHARVARYWPTSATGKAFVFVAPKRVGDRVVFPFRGRR